MIFGDMWAQVVAAFGFEAIPNFDEKVYVKGLINRGVLDMLSRTRCTVRCVDIRTLAGISEYTLDHQILALVDLEDGLRRVPRDSAWTPSFTLIRSDILRIQPTPSEDGQVQVWAVQRPQEMAADSDSPEMEQFGAIPPEYHDAPIAFAMWKAADYADDSGSQQGERYRIFYEGEDGHGGRLGQIKMLVNKRGTSRPPTRRAKLRPLSSKSAWVG